MREGMLAGFLGSMKAAFACPCVGLIAVAAEDADEAMMRRSSEGELRHPLIGSATRNDDGEQAVRRGGRELGQRYRPRLKLRDMERRRRSRQA